MFKNAFYYITILFLFLTISCTNDNTIYNTDLDNLYAFKKDSITKDSIVRAIYPKIKKALELKSTINNTGLIDSVLNKLRWTNEKEVFFKPSKKAIKDAKKQGNNLRLANTYQNIAIYYHDINQLDSVYYYYTKAENIYEKEGNSLAVAENKFYQSRLLFELGLYIESEIKLTSSIKYLQEYYPNNPVLIEANQLRALHDVNNENYDKALTNFKQTLDRLIKDEGKFLILPKEKYYPAIAILYANIAGLYIILENYNKAEYYSLKSINYLEKNHNDLVFSFINTGYQISKYRLNKNQDVVSGLLVSYNILEKLDHTYFKIDIAMMISSIYLEQNNVKQALSWAHLAYKEAKKDHFFRQQKEIVEFILSHSHYRDPKLIDELITLTNNIEVEQNRIHQLFTKIEYDSTVLSKENYSLKQKIHSVITLSIIITLSLIYIMFYLRLRSKSKDLYNFAIQKSNNEEILKLLYTNNTIEHNTIVKERRRISKDLHDGIVNSIFVIKFNLQLIKTPENKMQELLIDELDNLAKTVRTISHSLAESSLFKNNSFENLLELLVHKQVNSFNTKFSIKLQKDIPFNDLSAMQKMDSYLIVQEVLQNVNKHSYASECVVSITSDSEIITFTIQDNGQGFQSKKNTGLGLLSIKERADNIKATLKIQSDQKNGTTIILSIPLLNVSL